MLETAVKVLEQADNPANLAGALNNLADLYRQRGNFKQALAYFEQRFEPFGQVGEFRRRRARPQQHWSDSPSSGRGCTGPELL